MVFAVGFAFLWGTQLGTGAVSNNVLAGQKLAKSNF